MAKVEIGPAIKEYVLPLLKQKRDELDQLIKSLEDGEEQEFTIASQQTVTTRKKTRGPGRPKKPQARPISEETGKRCYTSTIQAILRRANHPMDVKGIFHFLQKDGYQTKYQKLEVILARCVKDNLVLFDGGMYLLPEDKDS